MKKFLFLHALLLLPVLMGEPIPWVAERVGAVAPNQFEVDTQLEEARALLDSGLSTLAGQRFELILKKDDLSDADRVESQLGLVDAFVAQGAFAKAQENLDAEVLSDLSPAYQLRSAVLSYLRTEGELPSEPIRPLLASIDIEQIEESYVAWYHFLRAMEMREEGNLEEIGQSVELAIKAAKREEQRAFFRSELLRLEMLAESPDLEATLSELKKMVDRPRGVEGIAYVLEQYVTLLEYFRGASDAADALEDALSSRSLRLTAEERARLTLLRAILLGADTPEGREILEGVIRGGTGARSVELALELRIGSSGNALELVDFLSSIVDQSDAHPLGSRIYFLRSQLLLGNEATAEMGERDARYLLEEYPGALEVPRAYELLAFAAIKKTPPEYRAAAEYLLQYKDASQSVSEDSGAIDVWIGDAYFLNEDYANAADFYRSAFLGSDDADIRGAVFLRLVIADLRRGGVDRAVTFVDEFGGSVGVPDSDRWKAEWNISQTLLAAGELERALARVRSLLGSEEFEAVPTILDIRLRWLNLYLSSASRDLDGLSEEAALLLRRLDSMPTGAGLGADINVLRSEVMLLRADALLGEGDFERAVEILRQIRVDFSGSEAAERTFLSEASYFASTSDFRAAQTILVAMVDAYPEGQLASEALFQAALYAERRGPEFFRDAILILARLVEEYPDALVAYDAVLRQGDLLRLSNDFASAQLLYDNLVNTFPDHPLRHRAELGRADCMVALAEGDDSELADAAVVLERFLDLPDLSNALRAEAAHKWGMTLIKREAYVEAREVFAGIVSRFLVETERAAEMGQVGQYWLARSVFALGELLESAGEADEARRLYRLMIALNMPGRTISAERLDNLSSIELR